MNLKVLSLILLVVNFSLCEEEVNDNGIEEDYIEEGEDLSENEVFFSGTSRIVNGQIVRIDSVPYLASISKNGRKHSGASIISNKWLLTAAHCFDDTTTTIYKVRTGSSRASRYGKVFEVAKIVVHPLYDFIPFDNDFALVQIKGTITFNDKQQVIKLAESNKEAEEGTEVVVSGFGVTQNSLHSSEFLRGVVVNITNQQECADAYGEVEITSNMFCAGLPEIDSCSGDSGGPVEQLSDGELIGVVSFGGGEQCADPTFKGVYAKVSAARLWIKEVSGV